MKAPARPIRVMLVDDSPSVLASVRQLVQADPGFIVVATQSRAELVVGDVARFAPQVLVMDFDMPRLDGAQLTAEIMARTPTPILILTGIDSIRKLADAQFRALSAGAVELMSKSELADAHARPSSLKAFHRKLRVLSGVLVVPLRSKGGPIEAAEGASTAVPAGPAPMPPAAADVDFRIVALAASTGGPPAVETLLRGIGTGIRAPIVLVQHIGPEFIEGFVSWLGRQVPQRVVIAADGMRLEPGVVHVSPGGRHMAVESGPVAVLDDGEPMNCCRPSADRLFLSVAASHGRHAVGVLLTGMGRDGASGLKVMRDRGAYTIVQDRATSVVFGMPAEAARLGAHCAMLPIGEIGPGIGRLLRGAKAGGAG